MQWNLLKQRDLQLLQPYQPNISVTWLFQQAMRIPMDKEYPPQAINDLLRVAFKTMDKLGDRTLKPFLQDVIQFPALSQTMIGMLLADPVLVLKIAKRVGLPALLDWTRHCVLLGGYDLSDRLSKSWNQGIKNLLPEQQYALNCQLNAWKYGSGMDYFD